MKSLWSETFFIVGPCSLESMEQMAQYIPFLKKHNLKYLRAPLFKPRTHPDSFQGLGISGIKIANFLKLQGAKLVIEVCSKDQLESVISLTSIIQIGARNMQNFELLKDIGKIYSQIDMSEKPFVMLKRGFGNNFNEWLNSALYLEKYGVPKNKIILCERGTRNSCSPTGVTLDFGMALKAKAETDYKIIVDPSHGSSDDRLVLPLTKASLFLNLDGLMIEAHPTPKQSVSDAHQAISLLELDRFLEQIKSEFSQPVQF